MKDRNRDRIELFTKEHAGLAHGFWVNPNSCGNNKHYEEYIRYMAIPDKNKNIATTHAYIRTDENGNEKLLGYITLRATSYIQMIDGVTHGHPAMEIFELAVAQEAERQSIGSDLVKFAFSVAVALNDNLLGVQYITLCADKQAVPFYKKFHFEPISDRGEVPRENWNVDCEPMFLRLEEKIK